MKRLALFVSAAAMMLLWNGTASAIVSGELLTNGDFQADGSIVPSDFNSATGPYNVWLANPTDWNIVNNGLGGKSAGDFYAEHFQNSARLTQGVNLNPGDFPAGTPIIFGFEYFLQSGSISNSENAVYVLGLKDSDGPITTSVFPGDGFPPGDIIFSSDLATLSDLKDTWVSAGAVGYRGTQEYDSLAVVFTSGDFGQNAEVLRGVDNVTLKFRQAQVPEPGSFFLIGSAISAIVLARRRIQG